MSVMVSQTWFTSFQVYLDKCFFSFYFAFIPIFIPLQTLLK